MTKKKYLENFCMSCYSDFKEGIPITLILNYSIDKTEYYNCEHIIKRGK